MTMPKLNFLAIITARGGSKGLPNKNVLDLHNKPVIAYSIEAALQSKHIDRVIVSTDDTNIANIAQKFGAEVPFIRPPDLATDTVPHLPVLQHAITFLEKKEACQIDAIVLLQPTSPLRTSQDIDAAIELFLRHSADSVVSVEPTIFIVEEQSDGKLRSVMNQRVGHFHRQSPNKLYNLNGAIYVVARNEIVERNRMMGERTYPYVMARNRSIEIDDQDDFDLIARILERRGAI